MKRSLTHPWILPALVLGMVCSPLPAAQNATIEQLRCEYRNDPLGIDAAKPRLSWIINSELRGEKQTAYQVLVASAPELLAKDLGDL